MRLRVLLFASLVAVAVPAAPILAQLYNPPSAPLTSPEERAALHRGPEWQQIAPHLPNPDTATAAALETAGDVLRARRFPEDALDYYGYAMARGGDVSELLNKMGVVRLELQQNGLAHEMFLRTVRVQKKNSVAWNNLGVTEYVAKNYKGAIADYRRAIHLKKADAVYRANLAMAYLENKEAESARDQFARAIRLDPWIMQERDSGGSTLQLLGSDKYGEMCFELADLYARRGRLADMRLWLAKASESGFDVRRKMADDDALRPYLSDPRIKLILSNAAQLHGNSIARTKAPPLGPATSAPVSPAIRHNFD